LMVYLHLWRHTSLAYTNLLAGFLNFEHRSMKKAELTAEKIGITEHAA
jgi:hypothetical protein